MANMIVHISGDYPDSHQPRKTKAVSSLVDAVHDTFDQHVYSINRTSPKGAALAKGVSRSPLRPEFGVQFQSEIDGVTTLLYEGLPAGLYMASTLSHLADRIAEDMVRRGIKPDIIHGHKLTLEGLIAEKLSSRFGCPYALSIQVNTDRKVMKFRPDLLKSYRRIYHNAAVVFPFSAVGKRVCDTELGSRSKPTYLLPCTSPEDRIISPKLTEPVLASVFHLKDYRNKNVDALVRASGVLQRRQPSYGFQLYGGGTPEDEKAIDDLVARHQAKSFVRKGPIPHQDVQAMLNDRCGFAMVSKRETFGMVFLEALLAGCPVVYPKNWAIDGFFDDASFAISASTQDYDAIEAAMEQLIVDQQALKKELSIWQESGWLAQFQRDTVERTYREALMGELATHR